MIPVCPLQELPPGEVTRVSGGSAPIAVFNVDGDLYAVDDTCTHQDAALSDGWVEGCFVECPLHSSQFDLRTGKPHAPPAIKAVRTHAVHVNDGQIYVVESAEANA
ncbi:bifunctional 3-phenylpropionate/cinnamic acid dioxygenase ferredoxin subunit [Streptomyces albidoflavus]|uniref:bifunctional 3-phenylpropionate/cinnamic acid dioxygenase ferredoxin subunit n=1 Tax=Streptomyces albidoflavus TaxID=1886 RepID=UPI00101E8249|nr:bifunctional 3-phenylpropionate/cinnamic acid dioxygenase ferredoxin subunit [Streptomyces albidoflavus]RZD76778.1 bifunctional 3-phenylpropionate/cinnamic acid dioxygenase ferredoxin subunit [Streptomyces albidoflavus]